MEVCKIGMKAPFDLKIAGVEIKNKENLGNEKGARTEVVQMELRVLTVTVVARLCVTI